MDSRKFLEGVFLKDSKDEGNGGQGLYGGDTDREWAQASL